MMFHNSFNGKTYLTALLAALLLILTLAAPVYAFDPPTQGTDNATDVILWPGDTVNVTANTILQGSVYVTSNASIYIEDVVEAELEGEVTVEVTGLEDFFDDIFLFIVIAAISAYAILKKDAVFAKIITSPLLIAYGARLAVTDTVYSTLWMAGVVIALIGTSLLFKVIWDAVGEKVKKYFHSNRGEPES